MKRKEIILPKIYKPKSGVFTDWFVYFSVFDEFTGRMKRFRRFKGFRDCKSLDECQANANKLKLKYTRMLRRGWSPFENKGVIWSDTLAYVAINKQRKPIRRSKKVIPYYLSKFLESISPGLVHGSMQKFQSELRIFNGWLLENNLDDVDISFFTSNNAVAFFNYLITERKLSGKSLNNYTLVLKRVWRFAQKKRRLLQQPWAEIQKYKERTKPQKPLKRGILAMLKSELEVTDPQLWLAAQFQYYCFIRPKELRYMQISHLDLYDGRITLPGDITKPGKTRTVDIPSEFLSRLIKDYGLTNYPENYYVFSIKGHPDERHIGKNYFWNHFNKVRTRLGLPHDYKFYGFKHTGAVVALRAGADIKDIQHQMGHSDISVTDEYLKNLVGYESDFFKKKMPVI